MSNRYSPGEIKIMLHYHTTSERWEPVTEWSASVLARLHDEGLVEYRDGVATSTALGAAFVECLCSTPVPVVAYLDPRTRQPIEA